MPIKREQYHIGRSPLFRLSSKKRLARLLGLSLPSLRLLALNANDLYREWDEDKPGGGARHIEDPKFHLKRIQSRLAGLLMRIKSPDYLMCPAPRRSYVANAALHVGARVIHTLDIKSYFPSTPARRVFWFWRTQLLCSEDVAGVLTGLATFHGHLPTGSPLSPILSFYAHFDMWEDIESICTHAGCRVTVYVDDLTISGDHIPRYFLWAVRKRIARNGLQYHKERHYEGRVAEVTGLIVGEDSIRLPHRRHMALHTLRRLVRVETDSDVRMKAISSLKGSAGQFKQVHDVNELLRQSPE